MCVPCECGRPSASITSIASFLMRLPAFRLQFLSVMPQKRLIVRQPALMILVSPVLGLPCDQR